MSSEAQIAANRRNAINERQEDYDANTQSFVAKFQPQDATSRLQR